MLSIARYINPMHTVRCYNNGQNVLDFYKFLLNLDYILTCSWNIRLQYRVTRNEMVKFFYGIHTMKETFLKLNYIWSNPLETGNTLLRSWRIEHIIEYVVPRMFQNVLIKVPELEILGITVPFFLVEVRRCWSHDCIHYHDYHRSPKG